MNIEIIGSPKKISADETIEAVDWFLKRLCDTKSDDLFIEVEFKSNFSKHTGQYAAMSWVDSPIRPKEFQIELDSRLSEITTLTAIAHECVHIKQYALGEMRDYIRVKPGETKRQWLGKLYEHFNEVYWELPWEIDAHGREKGLVDMFLKQRINHTETKQKFCKKLY